MATAFSAPHRHDDVGVALRRQDEFIERGFNKLLIGPQDAVHVPPALGDVSPNTSRESDVGVGVHKDLQVHEIP